MLIVTISNDNLNHVIHGHTEKLLSGMVTKGINSIDSFTMELLPSNIGFNKIFEFKTKVSVYNTNKGRYEFKGRVLYSSTEMSDSGQIKKSVTCESSMGYLCDSMQLYVAERNWGVTELLTHILATHNLQVEPEKYIDLGEVTVTDPNDNLYCGLQVENSFEAIKKKLIDVLGGEIRLREVDGKLYLDYLTKIGEVKSTKIALSRNMKSIVREKDPTSFVTRLIPYGAKLGDDTEQRLTIANANAGKIYIDDEEAIAVYGIHVGVEEWDDVTEVANLLSKGKQWLKDNNKVQIKYSITALDLSLLGLDIDDFDTHNYYPVENSLLDIDDTARVIKKSLNVCEEIKSTIEVGDNLKTLSELQAEYKKQLNDSVKKVGKIEADYVTNQALNAKLTAERAYTSSLIKQLSDEISLSVSSKYVTVDGFETYQKSVSAELKLKVGKNDNNQIVSMLNAAADVINITSNRLTITSDKFSLTADGTINAVAGTIGGFTIEDNALRCDHTNSAVAFISTENHAEVALQYKNADSSSDIASMNPGLLSVWHGVPSTDGGAIGTSSGVNLQRDTSSTAIDVYMLRTWNSHLKLSSSKILIDGQLSTGGKDSVTSEVMVGDKTLTFTNGILTGVA